MCHIGGFKSDPFIDAGLVYKLALTSRSIGQKLLCVCVFSVEFSQWRTGSIIESSKSWESFRAYDSIR